MMITTIVSHPRVKVLLEKHMNDSKDSKVEDAYLYILRTQLKEFENMVKIGRTNNTKRRKQQHALCYRISEFSTVRVTARYTVVEKLVHFVLEHCFGLVHLHGVHCLRLGHSHREWFGLKRTEDPRGQRGALVRSTSMLKRIIVFVDHLVNMWSVRNMPFLWISL